MKLTNRRVMASATMAALSIALLGGCGGGGDDDTASSEVASMDDEGSSSDSTPDDTATDGSVSPEDREEAMLEFAQCMRDHGIDMEDPQFDGEGGGINLEATPENEDEIAAAQEACEPILEDAMGDLEIDPEQEAEMREQALEYAQCMREHGIDMPDPQFQDGGFVIQEGPGGGPTDDADFEAADEECRPEGVGPAPGAGTNRDSANEDG